MCETMVAARRRYGAGAILQTLQWTRNLATPNHRVRTRRHGTHDSCGIRTHALRRGPGPEPGAMDHSAKLSLTQLRLSARMCGNCTHPVVRASLKRRTGGGPNPKKPGKRCCGSICETMVAARRGYGAGAFLQTLQWLRNLATPNHRVGTRRHGMHDSCGIRTHALRRGPGP